MACVGLLLLGEYREQFLKNPRAVITFEVFSQAAHLNGPGYLGVLVLFGAVFIIAIGISSALVIAMLYATHVFSLMGNSAG